MLRIYYLKFIYIPQISLNCTVAAVYLTLLPLLLHRLLLPPLLQLFLSLTTITTIPTITFSLLVY